MLAPEKRVLFSEQLLPDPGYVLDHALLTSFTLDLTTLMEVPVALTFRDWESENGDTGFHRIGILDAIQRHIGKLTVISQAGFIGGPPEGHPLLPLLEPAICPVVLPDPERRTFHPKVTLLRFTAKPDSKTDATAAVRYRLICSSRNLSPSRAWDTIAVLDGHLTDKRQEPSVGLTQFVTGTLNLVTASEPGIDPERQARLEQMATEIPQIEFAPPPGVESLELLPLGFGNTSPPEPLRPSEARLVVSPFLDEGSAEDGLLSRFAGPEAVLVSRQEELDRVPGEVLNRYAEVLVLSDLTQTALDDGDGDSPLNPAGHGLHAKLLVEDEGWWTRVRIGSPNFTERAHRSNIEFALDLTVSKTRSGMRKILGNEKDGLRRYLEPYRRGEADQDDLDADRREVERMLRRVSALLPQFEPTLDLSDEGDQTRDLILRFTDRLAGLPEGVELTVRPVSLGSDRAEPVKPGDASITTWADVPIPALTSLLDVRVEATAGEYRATNRFVLKARLLTPFPETRDRQIIQRLIDSPDHLLSYISLLLTSPDDEYGEVGLLGELTGDSSVDGPDGSSRGPVGIPLLERLVQAVERNPKAIDQVNAIVEDLLADDEGREKLPPGFEQVWQPILAARKRRRELNLE